MRWYAKPRDMPRLFGRAATATVATFPRSASGAARSSHSRSISLSSRVELSNGVRMPLYGLGTSHNQGGYGSAAALRSLDRGVRLFDTATRYGSEAPLGKDLRAAGTPREELFLSSKLWVGDYGSPRAALVRSLAALGVDYLDLFLVHWPGMPGCSSAREADSARLRLWHEMEALLEEGLCRAIGVSNFETRHLKPLLEKATVAPMLNQIELNPWQRDSDLVSFCRDNGVVVGGWSPLAKATQFDYASDDDAIVRAARAHGVAPANVLIRWSLQHGFVTIPKTTKPERVDANLAVFDFELTSQEMHVLDSMHENLKVSWDSSHVP